MVERYSRPISPLWSDGQPARHIIIDTESRAEITAGGHSQAWALGASGELSWDRNGLRVASEPESHSTPEGLWSAVLARHRRGTRLAVWAHNLAYDLRISRALTILPRNGYRLTGIVLQQTAAWASFASDAGTLLCCDLTSWLNAPLERIAADLGLGKVPLPADTSDLAELAKRCLHDVRVTQAAVGTLMEWVRANELGPFRPTGAGQSHAAWRRRFMTDAVHVHDDTRALAFERRAMWTGRCEAWRWGEQKGRGLTEFDMSLAYCRLAASESVPVELIREVENPSLLDYRKWGKLGGVLAHVTVETNTPCVPAEDGDRIHWPVGRFESMLWTPELDLAIDEGAKVTIHRAWLYRRRPALAAMAAWLIDELEHPSRARPLVIGRLLKHWSRTVVGRMALRYRSWEYYGTHPDFDLSLGLWVDLDEGVRTEILHVGHEQMLLSEMAEGASSTPMVVGWIMAACRVNLWRLLRVAGHDRVLYMDTDSVLVDDVGAGRLRRHKQENPAVVLAVKGRYRRVVIHGPRQIDLDSDARFSGVSKRSVRRGPLAFDSEQWSSLHQSLASGTPDRVTVNRVAVNVRGHDPRRDHLPGGGTAPHRTGGP